MRIKSFPARHHYYRVFIGMAYVLISISACKPSYKVESTRQSEYVFSDTNQVDTAVLSFIEPYRSKMESEMKTVLAESENPMEKALPEERLGNFVADACAEQAAKIYYPAVPGKIDFTFLNNGGLRRPLPAGSITRGDVFELMPFENELVVLTMSGQLAEKIFNFIASRGGAPVSGVRFKIDSKQAMEVTIQGNAFDTSSTYKVLTSDYLANGGDSYEMLKDLPRETIGLKVRDAIIQYLIEQNKSRKKISVNPDGRITNAK